MVFVFKKHFDQMGCKSHGFALAVVLLALFLLGMIGAFIARGGGSTRELSAQNKAALVNDLVTAVQNVKSVVDYCVADGGGVPTQFTAAAPALVPNYPFAVDAPNNACGVAPASSLIPAQFGWADNICCMPNPTTGSTTPYNPWLVVKVAKPVVNGADLFANYAQNDTLYANGGDASLPPDRQLVVAYANSKGPMNTLGGASGVTLAIRPATAYLNDASMQATMQSVAARLKTIGFAAFYCGDSAGPTYNRTVVVRLYQQSGTKVDPCPSATSTAVVP